MKSNPLLDRGTIWMVATELKRCSFPPKLRPVGTLQNWLLPALRFHSQGLEGPRGSSNCYCLQRSIEWKVLLRPRTNNQQENDRKEAKKERRKGPGETAQLIHMQKYKMKKS